MQETELKLSLPAADTSSLEQLLDRMALRSTCKMLRNIYYDTPDHFLHRERIALRIRQQPQQDKVLWIQTLKTGGGSDSALSQRGEWETELLSPHLSYSALQPTPWSQLDASGALFARLAPCFETVFQRTTWLLENALGSIEIALDSGEVLAGLARCPIAELECELRAGSPAVLFEMAEQIASQVALLPANLSKAQRGFGLVFGTLCTARKRKDFRSADADARIHKVLLDSFAQFSTNLNTLLLADSEDVLRQCLVGLRRFSAAQRMLQTEAKAKLPSMPIWSHAASLIHDFLRTQNLQSAYLLAKETLHRPQAGYELLQTSRWLALELEQVGA